MFLLPTNPVYDKQDNSVRGSWSSKVGKVGKVFGKVLVYISTFVFLFSILPGDVQSTFEGWVSVPVFTFDCGRETS